MDGVLLPLRNATALRAIAAETYHAIDALNAADEYGKACCWLDKDDEPATAMEQLVSTIATHDLNSAEVGACDLNSNTIAGFEWWLQKRPLQAGMPFHHDSNWNDHESGDVAALDFASCSTVTFLNDGGGPLVVLAPHEPSDEAQPLLNSRATDAYARLVNSTLRSAKHAAYLSWPAVGKHVRFRGSLYHGVLGSPSAERDAERFALVIAYWPQPLARVKRYPREHFVRMLNRRSPEAVPTTAWRALDVLPDEEAFLAGGASDSCLSWREPSKDEEVEDVESKDAVVGTRFRLRVPRLEREAPGSDVFVHQARVRVL